VSVWDRVGLRARLTLIATAALAVGLAAGSILLLHGFATSRLHAIDSASGGVAGNIAGLVAADAVPPTLPVLAGQSGQVLTAGGQVLAVSPGTSRTLPLVPVGEVMRLARTGPRNIDVDEVTATGLNRVLVRAVRVDGKTAYVVIAESLKDERATLHSLTRFVVIAVPVLVLVVGATVWLLLGRALGAVSALRIGAESVTDPGGGVRLPLPSGRDEIHALAVTLNAMLDRLDAAAARERRFVADVAHELRSPLASMRTQLEVAAGSSEGALPAELLAGALADSERLEALVADLLVLARMEAESPVVAEPVDLAELAGGGGPGLVVLGDRRALARAVDNLVANANRHAASEVALSVERVGGLIELRVDDDGAGVPAADRSRIFERFVRLDDARARDDGGTGLGLSIVRAVALAHGGTVRVEDSPLGGARFVLSVPVAGVKDKDKSALTEGLASVRSG
jgi:signal transduction histidine kinase